MHSLRRPLLVLAAALLPALLFATAFTVGVLRVTGDSESVKKVLSESGIYNSVTGEVLKDARISSGSASQVSLTNPEVKKAAEAAFSPQLVQNSTEQVIDGIYKWLDGKTPLPDFKVDLTAAKASFGEKVGDAAQNRAGSLPVCPAGVSPSSFDPFSASCLPRGVTPTQVGAQAENDVIKGEGFLEDSIITANTIKEEGAAKSVFADQLKDAPTDYQRFKTIPIVLIVLTILTIAGIILLSSSKARGLKKVGIILLVIGGIILLSAWALNHVTANRIAPEIKLENKVLQNNVKKLVTDTVQRVNKGYGALGGVYVVLGALTTGGGILLTRSNSKKGGANSSQAASTEPETKSPKPAQSTYKTPPKRKNPRKIQ